MGFFFGGGEVLECDLDLICSLHLLWKIGCDDIWRLDLDVWDLKVQFLIW